METYKCSTCPDWKAYFNSLTDLEQDEIRKKYNFTKY